MAYLRSLPGCAKDCGRPATHELLNRRNASFGKFCKRCGERELERLGKQELRDDPIERMNRDDRPATERGIHKP